jgi:hypothetical protein
VDISFSHNVWEDKVNTRTKVALFRHFYGSNASHFVDLVGTEDSQSQRVTDWVEVELVLDADLAAAAFDNHLAAKRAKLLADIERLGGAA